jgi:hypothetical protein
MAIIISKALSSGFTATYAKPHSSPSLRLDTGQIELVVALYKDADARFSNAEPCGFDRHNLKLTDAQRDTIVATLYEAMDDAGLYPGAEVRDPDPEKYVEPPVPEGAEEPIQGEPIA